MTAKLEAVLGNIVDQKVEILVTAANKELAGGGGVDAVVHKGAGPELLADLKKIGGCPTGSAVITQAYSLANTHGIKHVIHAVGPIYKDGKHSEATHLAAAYAKSMELANEARAASIAFPLLSAGAYGYPLKEAAAIAVKTLREEAKKSTTVKLVRIVAFDDKALDAIRAVP
jgi:O-acetyl-ADP-ribose deacetylase (regulator of RNase III)